MRTELKRVLSAIIPSIVILLALLSARGAASAANQLSPPWTPTPTQWGLTDAALVNRLQAETGGRVHISRHAQTGKVRFIGSDLAHPVRQPIELASGSTPEDAARQFLATYGRLFGLRDQAQELAVMRSRTASRGRSFVRFQQILKGIPVFGGELIVQLDVDKNIISASGEVVPDLLDVDISPAVGADDAREIARRLVARGYGLGSEELRISEPELWIYNPILLEPGINLNRLVWRMDVYARDLRPIDELVLVDAQRGVVVLHFNQTSTGKNRVVYDNNNDTAAGLPGRGPVRTEGQPATGIADVDSAYDYAGDVYDFYQSLHGRDSIDNAGMTITSTVRYCPPQQEGDCPYENSFWSSQHQQMVYGDGEAQVDDIVGHELTHGVTNSESNLFYYMQSGAMNEALSDIWGEFIDLTNGKGNDTPEVRWLMFEDLRGGASRNMKDPTNPPNPCGAFPCDSPGNVRQPDRIGSQYYYCGGDHRDNGGVHINSGVANKAAYLMVDGDTFNGYTVSGIGIDKTARLFYEVQTNLLTSAADYNDLGDNLQQACTNLIGTAGISGFDCQQVANAVAATEMSQQPATCPATQAPVCPAGQSTVNLFFDNLEAGPDNWGKDANVGISEWYWEHDYATSGVSHLWGVDVTRVGDYYVYMNADVALPANSTPYLHFNHAYSFDDFCTEQICGTFDGGVLEYSTNGGTTWADAASFFTHNGYNGTIDTRFDNPLAGRPAFVAESNGYISSRLNLRSLAGQNVRFRFRIGTDGEAGTFGWYLDDVRLYTCSGSIANVQLPLVLKNFSPAQVPPTPTPTATRVSVATPTATPSATPSSTPPSPQDLVNGDFEDGPTAWDQHSDQGFDLIVSTAVLPIDPHSGTWAVWLGGENDEFAWIRQAVTIPPDRPYLSYWHWIASQDDTCGIDIGGVLIDDGSGDPEAVDGYWLCDSTATGGWMQRIIELTSYAGQSVDLIILASTDSQLPSSLFIDDVSFQGAVASSSRAPIDQDAFDAERARHALRSILEYSDY